MADNIVSMPGSLSVVEQDGILVVDSRLVAERLGIEHRSFMRTIDRYIDKIQALGVLRFEIAKPAEGSAGGRPERYCLLSEPQSTFVMMLSRNTDMVVECKLNLTQAFERAKHLIRNVMPAQSEELCKLQLENDNMAMKLKVYEAQQKTLAAAGLMALTAPALVEAVLLPGVTVIEKVEHIDRTVVVDHSGKVVSESDGAGITAIQRSFGFKSTKAAWEWLESVGYGKDSGHWQKEPDFHETLKLKRESASELKKLFAQHRGDRQKLMGEL